MLMLIEALSSLEVSMIYTALPTILRDIPDPAKVGWLITAYMLVQAGAGAIGGRLGDLFGRRRVLSGVILCCAIGSFMSAATDNFAMMIAGRAIQGISGAILPLCYSIARDCLPKDKVPFWIGALTGAYAALTGVGYVLGGVLSDLGSWHLIFYFAGGFALLLLLPTALILPDSPGSRIAGEKIDVVGGLLFVPGLAALLIGISNGGFWGWFSPMPWAFIISGLATMLFWARYELQCPRPLLDVRLPASRERPSNIGACNTARSPPNINPQMRPTLR